MIKHLRKRVMRTGRQRSQGKAWVISRDAVRAKMSAHQQEALL